MDNKEYLINATEMIKNQSKQEILVPSQDNKLVTVDNCIEICQQCLNYADRLEGYLGLAVLGIILLLVYILYKRGRFEKHG